MIPVPLTDSGPDMDVVEKLVANDPQIKGMWCVPKYSNPSGAVYSNETIERLAKMKTAARDFRLFWDNAYAVHHLTAERIEIANIDEACARHGNPNRAFIFGSTSKVTFAGAGVGVFAGSKDNVGWYLKRIEKRTIGGDKVNQLRHVRLLKNTDGIATLMDRHRAIMAPKFEKVLEMFDEHLGNTGVANLDAAEGRLLHHPRCAGWLREAGREAGEGSGRRADARGCDPSAGQRSAGSHHPHCAELPGAGGSCAGGGRCGAVGAAGGDGEVAREVAVTLTAQARRAQLSRGH